MLVAKIYHQSTNAHIYKLAAMLANPPDDPMAAKRHSSIAWPVDLLQDAGNSQAVGFLMPRIRGMHEIIKFYNPTLRYKHCPLFTYAYLHRTARNLAAAVRALHVRGYVIGDINQKNILVADTALVTLLDTDSFQVCDPYNGAIHRCPVGTPEFTPPELQGKKFDQVDRAPEHDLFGLAVVIFQLLMEGVHPFAGGFTKGVSDPSPLPETRIAAGHFPYATRRSVPYQPMPSAPPFDVLHPKIGQLFVRCFEDGHSNPSKRPEANVWQNTLEEAEQDLTTCKSNSQHRYGKHLKKCPWCERAASLGGIDPFPSQRALQTGQHFQTPLPSVGTPPPVQPPVVTPSAPKKSQLPWILLPLLVGGIIILNIPNQSDQSTPVPTTPERVTYPQQPRAATAPTHGHTTPVTPTVVTPSAPKEEAYDPLPSGHKAQVCTLSDITDNGTTNGTLYAIGYGGKARKRSDITIISRNNTKIVLHLLIDSKAAYIWGSGNQGVKSPVEEKSVAEILGQFTNSKCRDWTPNNSVFQIPTNIKFTEVAKSNRNLSSTGHERIKSTQEHERARQGAATDSLNILLGNMLLDNFNGSSGSRVGHFRG